MNVDMLTILNVVSFKELLIFVPVLPAVIICLVVLKLFYQTAEAKDKSVLVLAYILLTCLTISAACIGFTWRSAPAYGVFQGIVSYLPIGLIMVNQYLETKKDRMPSNIFVYVTGFFVGISAVSIVVALPKSVIPQYRQIPPSHPQTETLSTTFLIESLDKIGKSFQEVEKKVKNERGRLESSIQRLLSDFERSKEEVEKLSEQHKHLQAKAEYYKQIASIEEPQARAVESMLRRSRYVDYSIGFLVGIASSATAIVLSKIGPKVLRKKTMKLEE